MFELVSNEKQVTITRFNLLKNIKLQNQVPQIVKAKNSFLFCMKLVHPTFMMFRDINHSQWYLLGSLFNRHNSKLHLKSGFQNKLPSHYSYMSVENPMNVTN